MLGSKTRVRLLISFFLISIFMLFNGSFFGWLFSGTPLVMWRQLIWIIGLVLCYFTVPSIHLKPLNKVFNVEGRLAFAILILSFITIWSYNFNTLRIAYAFWLYFAGLPFILLPFLISRFNVCRLNTFYSIFTFFGLFLSIGLVLDYMSGGFFTEKFLIRDSKEAEGLLESGRFCFISEAPTTFGVFYSFCMFCGLMRMHLAKKFAAKLSYLLICASFLVGCWFTGSRQILAVLGVMFIGGLAYYITKVRDTKAHIALGVLLAIIFVPTITSFLLKEDIYSDRYSNESIREDPRSKSWIRGWHETVVDDISIFVFGKAVALVQGQKAQPGELTGSHYENSFFARLSECGIVGVILLCYPAIYILRRLHRWNFFQILICILTGAFLFTCYISPNGQHQTTQAIMYIALGMFICRQYFDPGYVRSSSKRH